MADKRQHAVVVGLGGGSAGKDTELALEDCVGGHSGQNGKCVCETCQNLCTLSETKQKDEFITRVSTHKPRNSRLGS